MECISHQYKKKKTTAGLQLGEKRNCKTGCAFHGPHEACCLNAFSAFSTLHSWWRQRWEESSLTPFPPCKSGSAGKETTCNAGNLGLKDPLEKRKGSPLQYSGLENFMDCMGWQTVGHDWATFTKSQKSSQDKNLNSLVWNSLPTSWPPVLQQFQFFTKKVKGKWSSL